METRWSTVLLVSLALPSVIGLPAVPINNLMNALAEPDHEEGIRNEGWGGQAPTKGPQWGNDMLGEQTARQEKRKPQISQYVLKKGDTMFTLAHMMDMTIATLRSLNPQISDPGFLQAGDIVNVPSQGLLNLVDDPDAPKPMLLMPDGTLADPHTPEATSLEATSLVVQDKEKDKDIDTWADGMELFKLKDPAVKPRLKRTTFSPRTSIYVSKEGESLDEIARKLDMPPAELLAANPKVQDALCASGADTIEPGIEIRFPLPYTKGQIRTAMKRVMEAQAVESNGNGTKAVPAKPPSVKKSRCGGPKQYLNSYVVRSCNMSSLEKIANSEGILQDDLLLLNPNITSITEELEKGTVVWLPPPEFYLGKAPHVAPNHLLPADDEEEDMGYRPLEDPPPKECDELAGALSPDCVTGAHTKKMPVTGERD